MARRFHSEIKLARKVRHPHVCAIHEYGEDGALRYITMEFIEGVDLRQVLARDGAFAPARAYELALQVAGGLKAIHDAGVIHRDLKPHNVLVGERNAVKLIDFGLAKATAGSGMTATGVLLGTPHYMSPEQVRGKAVDAASDLYSLGALAFHLVGGRPPFSGDNAIAVGFAHCAEPVPSLKALRPDVPPALEAIITRALAKAPADRPRSPAEFKAALTA